MMQPNYVFSDVGLESFEETAYLAKKLHIGVEMDFLYLRGILGLGVGGVPLKPIWVLVLNMAGWRMLFLAISMATISPKWL